jgi:uroporphyrinogen decarboxylase
VILYVNGGGHLLEAMRESGADVLSIDWRTPLGEARRRLPGMPLQGNLDPGLLLGTPEEVSRRTLATIRETGGVGHIVNLGHGVLPGSRLECVEAFFAAVRGHAPAAATTAAEASASR